MGWGPLLSLDMAAMIADGVKSRVASGIVALLVTAFPRFKLKLGYCIQAPYTLSIVTANLAVARLLSVSLRPSTGSTIKGRIDDDPAVLS